MIPTYKAPIYRSCNLPEQAVVHVILFSRIIRGVYNKILSIWHHLHDFPSPEGGGANKMISVGYFPSFFSPIQLIKSPAQTH